VDQNWHKDVDEPYKLFGGAGSFEEANAFVGLKDDAIVKALPFPQASPGALVFFALHDVPLRMGPTEVTVGSHLYTAPELQRVGVFEHKMALRQGDIMVMDIRTLHHGTANLLDRPRYATMHMRLFSQDLDQKPTGLWSTSLLLQDLPLPAVRSRLLHRPGQFSGQANEAVGCAAKCKAILLR
jgi:ectoine hydroxylase-related dioxygenase (phytanoyl-CoA dioxygenase family)